MSQFVVRATYARYLELRPFGQVWTWGAGNVFHATKFPSRAAAERVIAELSPAMRADVGEVQPIVAPRALWEKKCG